MNVCGVGEGVEMGRSPLPTYPQRYCDPASLVDIFLRNIWFLFTYKDFSNFDQSNEPSNEIDRVRNLDNSLSFGVKQNVL